MDTNLAQSLAGVDEADVAAIHAVLQADAQVEKDRRLAQRLEEAEDADADLESDDEGPVNLLKHQIFDKPRDNTEGSMNLANNRIETVSKAPLDTPTRSAVNAGSSTMSGPQITQVAEKKECVSCGDKFSKVSLLDTPCLHAFCLSCLIRLVQASMRDGSIYPPKCCGIAIPITTENSHLSHQLVTQFEAKKIEFETVDRTYCSGQLCSAFIPPESYKAGIASCPRCMSKTCVKCKDTWHVGACANDDVTKDLLKMANNKGWKRCGRCGHIIDKIEGCNHMCEYTNLTKCTHQLLYRHLLIIDTCDCNDEEDEDPHENDNEEESESKDDDPSGQPCSHRWDRTRNSFQTLCERCRRRPQNFYDVERAK
ncbi:e3 ubiquitin ligase ARIH1 [Fusarium beomiforme]|uniref:E3 ubiquitin ligase ARIH1 n=1 Tax=Fusarium beomiforme TaxID=44412 RepID=A0A9P5AUI9_9HYPO|nr:e3 ubiquitin ligase ARIH1 [Fusarium beomiforme]